MGPAGQITASFAAMRIVFRGSDETRCILFGLSSVFNITLQRGVDQRYNDYRFFFCVHWLFFLFRIKYERDKTDSSLNKMVRTVLSFKENERSNI